MPCAASKSRPVAEDRCDPAECRKEDRTLFEIIRYQLDFCTALLSEFGQFVDDIDLLFENERGGTFRTGSKGDVLDRFSRLKLNGLLIGEVTALAFYPEP